MWNAVRWLLSPAGKPAEVHTARAALVPETLEGRVLLSSSFTNINVTRMTGSQAEGSITVNPANPLQEFAASNIDSGDGLVVAISSDGGVTWSHHLIANDKDGLPPACCDPSDSFDSHGNLFLAYVNSAENAVIVLLSTDAGRTFTKAAEFAGDIDQPTVTTGPGSVWVTFQKSNSVVASGTDDVGLGSVGMFVKPIKIRSSNNGNFGDIAIGASGQVMLTYQVQTSNTNAKIFASVDPTGLSSPSFSKPILAATTHVADFDYIAAMPDRAIDAEAGLAYDRSGDPNAGRVYLVYSDENPAASGNTDTLLRYSDNGGSIWSNPIRVNDDTTLNAQFLPRVKVDNSTGIVGISWYDCRNDMGSGGTGDTDMIANDDAEYYATIVTPQAGGLVVSPNQQISAGASNATDDYTADTITSIDLGDYTGLDFFNGTLHPYWFDNSNSTGDNPNGPLKNVNAYTANVPASSFAAGSTLALGGLADSTGPVAALYFSGANNSGSVSRGKTYSIAVTYHDPAGVNLSSIGSNNLLVTGPNNFSVNAALVHAKAKKGGVVIATYTLTNPAGNWTAPDAGVYTINLAANQALNTTGGAATAGILGNFSVAAGLGKGSHSGGMGPRHHHHQDR